MNKLSIGIALAAIMLVLIVVNAMQIYAQAAGLAVIFPTAVKGVKIADPSNRWVTQDLDYASFMANLWNLATSAQGSMVMNFTGSYVEVYGNFSELPKQVSIQGGPGIRYGQSIWGGNPPAHPLYNIPKKVTQLPYAIFFANYTIYEDYSTLPLTVTFYLWTVKALRSGGTQPGDVLIIVRIYRHPAWPLTGAPLANLTAPLIVNGTLTYGSFALYVGDINRTSGGHTTVVFELLKPIRSGRVGIPIQDYISLAANMLQMLAPKVWTKEMVLNNTLQMIDFVVEWGSNTQGAGVFKWRLYEVSFLVGATLIEKTVTVSKTVTQLQTQTQPTTVLLTTTAMVPTTVSSILTTTQTQIIPSTITSFVTTQITKTLTTATTFTSVSQVTSTSISTSTTTITQTNWAATAVVSIILLAIGIAIGLTIKRK